MLVAGCINNERNVLMITKDKLEKLQDLEQEKKFLEDMTRFYPGAPNEQIREEAEKRINDLLNVLISELPHNNNQDYIFTQFKLVMEQFNDADSEEKDRMLMYLEEIMTILGISTSNGILNEWRYGFNP